MQARGKLPSKQNEVEVENEDVKEHKSERELTSYLTSSWVPVVTFWVIRPSLFYRLPLGGPDDEMDEWMHLGIVCS